MIGFICPVCKNDFFKEDKSFKCSSGHCFDISKFGYVNLLMSSKSSLKHHGDDRLMVRARRDFL
ncbi:MAG: methyltransferase, partial [Clostridia bacterium]|nr:methyltransferase [Clostridia bacterium]